MKSQRIVIYIIFILVMSSRLDAQIGCDFPIYSHFHSGNNMEVKQIHGGNIIGDPSGGSGLEVPKGSGKYVINHAGLWITGKTTTGEIKTSIEKEFQADETDFFQGPHYGFDSTWYCNDFDKIWKVTGAEIEAFILDFEDNFILDDNHPSIFAWPAWYNPHFYALHGYHLPFATLAPYYDWNNDGAYNPNDGDYPVLNWRGPPAVSDSSTHIKFRENLPTEMSWSIINDFSDIQTGTGGEGLGIEVGKMSWVYGGCLDEPILNQTIFNSLRIINRFSEPLDSIFLSIYNDFNIGGPKDDFLGCDTDLNTFFAYNRDDFDADDLGVNGYQAKPPVVACTFLNKPLHSFVGYNNSLFGANVGQWTDEAYFNLAQGKWGNGDDMTYGGDGHNGIAPTTYWYEGNPNEASDWTMINNPLIQEEDFYGIGSAGPIDIMSGEIYQLDYAYSFHRNNGQDHLGNVGAMYNEIPIIQDFYDNYFVSDCNTFSSERGNNKETFTIFPNPVKHTLYFSKEGEQFAFAKIAVYDVLGKQVLLREIVENEVTLPELSSGIYFLEVEWEGKKEIQRIMVEQ